MSELISGKEALIALANGETVEVADSEVDVPWTEICVKNNDFLGKAEPCLWMFINTPSHIQFRLKPRTITINGIEVPKSSDTYSGGLIWILCGTDTREYTSLALDENDELPAYFWHTEEEIKQVVAALRSVFGKK